MDASRHPLHADALPEIAWRSAARRKRVHVDPAIDALASWQVYRYCSLPEALALLGRGEWSFAHPRTWPDRYEHHVGSQLFAGDGPFARVAAHVKCMSLEFASHALWRTYAGPAGVVRIGIVFKDLVTMLARALPAKTTLHLARTRYLDERDLRRVVRELRAKRVAPPTAAALRAEAMRALSLKRAGFAYENELRVCLLSEGARDPAAHRTLTGLASDKVRSVLIDPYLPAWQADEIRRLLVDSIGLPAARVRQSGFDAAVPQVAATP